MERPPAAQNPNSPGTDLLLGALLFLHALLFTFGPGGWEEMMQSQLLVWDDHRYITQNGWLLNLTWGNATGIFFTSYFANYHPLTILTYMIEFQYYGPNAPGYKLTNLLLHGLTVSAAWSLFRSLGISRWIAFGLLAFFAVHPLRIESVYWVSERKDVLCGLFYILTLLAWVEARKRTGRKAALLLGLSFLAFLLAGFSKAMAVTIPLILIALEVTMPQPEGRRSRALVLAFLSILAVGFAYLNLSVQTEAIRASSSLKSRALDALTAPAWYAWKTLWPHPLAHVYPVPERLWLHPLPLALAVFFFIACAGLLAWSIWRRTRGLAFGFLAAGFALGPVSGIIPIGGTFAADRYSYIPTLLLFMGIGMEITPRLAERPRAQKAITLVFVITGLALSAVISPPYLRSWRDDASLEGNLAKNFPRSVRVQITALREQWLAGRQPRLEDAIAIGLTPGEAEKEVRKFQLRNRVLDQQTTETTTAASPNAELGTEEQMHQALLRGKPDGGLSAAREVAAGPPQESVVSSIAALVLIKSGFPAEAEALLASLRTPTMTNARLWGELARTQSNPDATRRAAARGLHIFPAEFECLKALVALQDPDLEPSLKRAINHPIATPQVRAYAHILLGRERVRQRDNAQAREHFQQALFFARIIPTIAPVSAGSTNESTILPQSTPNQNLLLIAMAFLDSGDAASALECFRLADPEEALTALRQGRRRHPNDPRYAQIISQLQPQP